LDFDCISFVFIDNNMDNISLIINGEEVKIKKIFKALERNSVIVYHIYVENDILEEKKHTN
jgi:hypothetical protein